MNFEVNRIKIDEVEISVKNIVAQCIRNWRMILVVGLLFAVLISGLACMSDWNGANSTSTGELTEEDIVAIENYIALEEKYDSTSQYRNNSILNNLDYTNVDCGVLTYYVDANENVKYDVSSAIVCYVNGGGLAKTLSEIEGYPAEKYMQEIVSASIAGAESGTESGVVTISVMGATKEDCLKYIESIEKEIETYIQSLKDNMGAFSMSLIQKNHIVKKAADVYAKQQTYLTEYTTVKNAYDFASANLTEIQKAYIMSMTEEENDSEMNLGAKFNLLYVVVGIVVGVLIALIVIICITIFSGKIQTDKELLKRLNICHLGNVYYAKDTATEKFIHKVLYKNIYFDVSRQINTISKRVDMVLKNDVSKKVYMVGTFDVANREDIEKWMDAFKMQGIECIVIGNIINVPEKMDKLVANDNVVLVEEIGKTKIKDVYEEATLCMDAKVKVVGYISVYA